MAAAARACAPAHGPVHTGRPSTGFRVFACVCLLASSSLGVCHRRVCPCDRVRVQSFRICDPGPPLNGRPSGVADHRGLLRARWPGEAPCVCACAVTGVGVLGGTAKERLGRWLGGGTVGPALGCALPWGPLGLLFCYPPRRWRVGATLRQASPGVLSACEPTPCFTTTRLAFGAHRSLGGSHPYAPLAPHPCVRRGSERAFGRRVCCPPSSHSSSQEISALCPALRGHGGSREMR